MKNVEVINLSALVSALPTTIEGKSLDPDTKAKLIILKYHYEKASLAFEDEMQEELKKLKPEGFDDRLQKIQQAENVIAEKKKYDEWKEDDEGEKPTAPDAGVVEAANKTLADRADFDKELAKVNEEYLSVRNTRLSEEYESTPRTIDYATYVKLVDFIGDSKVKLLNGVELTSVQCLGGLAAILKEQ